MAHTPNKTVNVVVYGDSFGQQSPRMSRLQAEEIVSKAGNWTAGYLCEESSGSLSCTEPTGAIEVDERDVRVGDVPVEFRWLERTGIKCPSPWIAVRGLTVTAINDVGIATSGDNGFTWHRWAEGRIAVRVRRASQPPKRTPSEILTEAINRAEAMLPHGIEVDYGVTGTNSAKVDASCPHCGTRRRINGLSWGERFPWTADYLTALWVESIRQVMRPCIEATCCDPLDRYVDGLRVREILDRHHILQMVDGLHLPVSGIGPCGGRPGPGLRRATAREIAQWRAAYALTPVQKAAAQQAWSAQLRARQAQAREKERGQVVCERDEDGE